MLALVLGALAACSSDPECGEPSYNGSASDEAWLALKDQESAVKVGDSKASVISEPAEGQVYRAADPLPTIRWSSPLTASLDPPRSPARRRFHIGDLFIGTAWAHLPPVTGVIHDLKITMAGEKCPLEILTTTGEHALDQNQWTKLIGKTLSLQITSAYLRDNVVTEGPFRPATPRTFQVMP